MPYCPDCGNKTRFDWYVEQSETRVFDAETGEHLKTEREEVYDSYGEMCAECGSTAVEG